MRVVFNPLEGPCFALLIPEHKIDEILERIDLVGLIGRSVELKKAGRSFKGRCPFHQEKTASFHVTPEMRRYKCFGCQAGGDAISFIQRYLGKSFVDAVKDLAKEAGVDLEAAEDPLAREKTELREVNDFASEYFRERLRSDAGAKAREYLTSRGVTDDQWLAFGLGYAPLAWSDLADRLRQKGLVDFGVRAGLIAPRTKADGFYDTFRGRLIIPIRGPEGRTIAFGGRVLEVLPGSDGGPKYLNSKESKLYNKSETLYGLDVAREEMRKKKSAVLVEGYFDCIGLHGAGVRNTVALCSTALTPGHMALLARMEAKELVLLLDGDEAGRKAVERLAGPLLAAGANARVALLPEGEDPDTYARTAGLEGVQKLLDSARPLTEHLFSVLLPRGAGAAFEEKMAALERLKPVTTLLPVGLARSAFFGSLARHSGLPAYELETALRGKTGQAPKSVPKPVAPPPAPKPEKAPDALEAFFVACLCKERSLAALDVYRVADELTHTGLRALWGRVCGGMAGDRALDDVGPSVRTALETASRQLPAEKAQLEPTFQVVCRKLKVRRIEEQLSHIARITAQLTDAHTLDEETRRLLGERGELLALKRQVLGEVSAVSAPPGRTGPHGHV